MFDRLSMEQKLRILKMAHLVCTEEGKDLEKFPKSLESLPDQIITIYKKFTEALSPNGAAQDVGMSWQDMLLAVETHYGAKTIAADRIGINRALIHRFRDRSVIPYDYFAKIEKAYRKITEGSEAGKASAGNSDA